MDSIDDTCPSRAFKRILIIKYKFLNLNLNINKKLDCLN